MKKNMVIITSIIAFMIVATVVTLMIMAGTSNVQKQTRFLMDTYVTIQVPGKKDVLPAIAKALDKMEKVDVQFNALNEKSQVYAFNNSNKPIDDPEIVYLTKEALKISEKSDGDYDITLHELSNLWGFYSKEPKVPEAAEIKKLLKHSGYKKIYIKDGKVYKTDPLVKLDYGSIAKGYAVRVALNSLKADGIKSALIDAGGDIYAHGKLNGKLWRLGIRHPRTDGMIGELQIEDMAVVTSGDYERFIIKDGKRYCHILSPKTGYSPDEIISVTAMSSDPMLADAWSTAVFVMGIKRSLEIAEKEPNLKIMVVDSDIKVHYSKDLEEDTTHK